MLYCYIEMYDRAILNWNTSHTAYFLTAFNNTKHQTLQNLNRNTISSLSSAASEAGKYTQIRPSINVRLDLTAKYTLHWVEVIKWHMSHVSSLARHSSFPAPRENCAFILSKPSLSLSAKHSLYFNCIIDTKIGQKSTESFDILVLLQKTNKLIMISNVFSSSPSVICIWLRSHLQRNKTRW